MLATRPSRRYPVYSNSDSDSGSDWDDTNEQKKLPVDENAKEKKRRAKEAAVIAARENAYNILNANTIKTQKNEKKLELIEFIKISFLTYCQENDIVHKDNNKNTFYMLGFMDIIYAFFANEHYFKPNTFNEILNDCNNLLNEFIDNKQKKITLIEFLQSTFFDHRKNLDFYELVLNQEGIFRIRDFNKENEEYIRENALKDCLEKNFFVYFKNFIRNDILKNLSEHNQTDVKSCSEFILNFFKKYFKKNFYARSNINYYFKNNIDFDKLIIPINLIFKKLKGNATPELDCFSELISPETLTELKKFSLIEDYFSKNLVEYFKNYYNSEIENMLENFNLNIDTNYRKKDKIKFEQLYPQPLDSSYTLPDQNRTGNSGNYPSLEYKSLMPELPTLLAPKDIRLNIINFIKNNFDKFLIENDKVYQFPNRNFLFMSGFIDIIHEFFTKKMSPEMLRQFIDHYEKILHKTAIFLFQTFKNYRLKIYNESQYKIRNNEGIFMLQNINKEFTGINFVLKKVFFEQIRTIIIDYILKKFEKRLNDYSIKLSKNEIKKKGCTILLIEIFEEIFEKYFYVRHNLNFYFEKIYDFTYLLDTIISTKFINIDCIRSDHSNIEKHVKKFSHYNDHFFKNISIYIELMHLPAKEISTLSTDSGSAISDSVSEKSFSSSSSFEQKNPIRISTGLSAKEISTLSTDSGSIISDSASAKSNSSSDSNDSTILEDQLKRLENLETRLNQIRSNRFSPAHAVQTSDKGYNLSDFPYYNAYNKGSGAIKQKKMRKRMSRKYKGQGKSSSGGKMTFGGDDYGGVYEDKNKKKSGKSLAGIGKMLNIYDPSEPKNGKKNNVKQMNDYLLFLIVKANRKLDERLNAMFKGLQQIERRNFFQQLKNTL